jgi:hypothetical protein
MTAKTSEWPIVTLRPYVSACYKVLCDPGHADCNNSAPDGCETDITLANCGGLRDGLLVPPHERELRDGGLRARRL